MLRAATGVKPLDAHVCLGRELFDIRDARHAGAGLPFVDGRLLDANELGDGRLLVVIDPNALERLDYAPPEPRIMYFRHT